MTHPSLHHLGIDSPLLAGWVKAFIAIYTGFSRNQGKLLNSWSMEHPVCYLEFPQGTVVVDLGQISLSPSAAWNLQIFHLISVNSTVVTHPQWFKS
jgi:hypothetical protein